MISYGGDAVTSILHSRSLFTVCFGGKCAIHKSKVIVNCRNFARNNRAHDERDGAQNADSKLNVTERIKTFANDNAAGNGKYH